MTHDFSLKTALFDLDGTLFDTEGQYTAFWSGIGSAYLPDIPDFAQRIKGTTLKQMFERYFPDSQVQSEVQVQLNEFEKNMLYIWYPGALDFIADLRRHGVKCAIVTSSNKKKMDSVASIMPEFSTYFDRIFTSEDFAASKPDPDCYIRSAAAMNTPQSECVIFEDALTGLAAGMASGIFTFGLPTTNPRSVISDKCHYVLDGFEGLTYEKLIAILSLSNK